MNVIALQDMLGGSAKVCLLFCLTIRKSFTVGLCKAIFNGSNLYSH